MIGKWTIRFVSLSTAIAALLLYGCDGIGYVSERIARNYLLKNPHHGCGDADEICDDWDGQYIADLHADPLLWRRDIWEIDHYRGVRVGHVDTERLLRGRMSLQVFAVATHTPLPRSIGNRSQCASVNDFDTQILLLAQKPDGHTLRLSTKARAQDQFDQFEEWAGDPRARLFKIEKRSDLVAARESGEVGALLAVEGLHWVGGSDTEIEDEIVALMRQGVRMASLTHRFSNALADSSEDCEVLLGRSKRIGLSDQGRTTIDKMIDQGMVVDLAHASSKTIEEVTTHILDKLQTDWNGAGKGIGLVSSHGGIYDTCPTSRNLSNESIRQIVLAGGVIGVGYWPDAVCWSVDSEEHVTDAHRQITAAFVAALRALSEPNFLNEYRKVWDVELNPYSALALGSDFDGAVQMSFDVSGVPHLLHFMTNFSCDELKNARHPANDPRLIEFCHTHLVWWN